jgi:N-acetylmuramoyl-L-alanine amidase
MNLNKLKIDFRDPMVILLCCLLLFLSGGSLIGGNAQTHFTLELDAAFGGDNPGYTGLINEASVNEKTVDALEALLKQDERFTVLRTHESGTGAPVSETAEKIKADSPQMVLSIHAAWSPSASDSGTRIYTDLPGTAGSQEALKLGEEIRKAFAAEDWNASLNYLYYHHTEGNTWTVDIRDVSAQQPEEESPATWTLFEKTDVPCVIVEQFFISNKADIERWNNEKGYQLTAQKYYSALCAYLGIAEMEFEAAEEAGG